MSHLHLTGTFSVFDDWAQASNPRQQGAEFVLDFEKKGSYLRVNWHGEALSFGVEMRDCDKEASNRL